MLDALTTGFNKIVGDDPFMFVLAMIGAYTVGKWLGEATQAKRFLSIPDDVRRLT